MKWIDQMSGEQGCKRYLKCLHLARSDSHKGVKSLQSVCEAPCCPREEKESVRESQNQARGGGDEEVSHSRMGLDYGSCVPHPEANVEWE